MSFQVAHDGRPINSSEVECSLCGARINRMGIAAHRGSLPCRAQAAARSQQRRGNTVAGKYYAILCRQGLAFKVKTKWVEGSRGRKAKLAARWWAPNWAVFICTLHWDYDRLPKDTKLSDFCHWLIPPANREAMVAAVKADPEMQEAIRYAIGQEQDPLELFYTYARERGLYKAPDTDK